MSPSLLLLLATVQAAPVALWERDTFTPRNEMDGTDNWTSGYANDPWRASRDGERIYPLTDDRNDNNSGYGSGWPADNWLIRGAEFERGGIYVEMGNTDDDATGVVFNHNGSDSFYLAYHSEDSAPPPVGGVNRPLVVLMKVSGGQVVSDFTTFADVAPLNDPVEFVLEREENTLRVSFDGDVVIEREDSAPLGPGRPGVYGYNAGLGSSDQFNYFEVIGAFAQDLDDDGVYDDIDNCEGVPNEDQVDLNDNGIGDACEDAPPADPNAPSGSDTDVDVPPGTPVGSLDDEALKVACAGCSGTGGTAWSLALLVGLAYRRRR